MTTRLLLSGLRGPNSCQRQARSVREVATLASSLRFLATTAAGVTPAASSSAPELLPPSMQELQTTLRAPYSFAVSALDKKLNAEGKEDISVSSALDDLLYRHLTGESQLTPGQLDTLRLLQRYNGALTGLRGQTVLAKVLSVSSSRLQVDTGYHGLTEIPRDDVTIAHVYTPDGPPTARLATHDVRPGDLLRLRVDSLYTPYGDMQLTAIREDTAQQRRVVWDELRRLMDQQQAVSGRVLNDCPGGFAVGIAGFVAFLPAALAATATSRQVGVRQSFVIVAMNPGRQRIVVRDPAMQQRSRR